MEERENQPSESERSDMILRVDLSSEIQAIAAELQRDKAKGIIKSLLDIATQLEKQVAKKREELGAAEECLDTAKARLHSLAAGDLSVLEMQAEKPCPTKRHGPYNEFYFKECPRCRVEREAEVIIK